MSNAKKKNRMSNRIINYPINNAFIPYVEMIIFQMYQVKSIIKINFTFYFLMQLLENFKLRVGVAFVISQAALLQTLSPPQGLCMCSFLSLRHSPLPPSLTGVSCSLDISLKVTSSGTFSLNTLHTQVSALLLQSNTVTAVVSTYFISFSAYCLSHPLESSDHTKAQKGRLCAGPSLPVPKHLARGVCSLWPE